MVAGEPFELTARETTALTVAAMLGLGALVAGGVISAFKEIWWPLAIALGLVVVLCCCHIVYVARTRRQPIRSVLLLLVPERWRHPSGLMVAVVVVVAVASCISGLLAGRGPVVNAVILGVVGAWCGARLVAPVAEADPERPDAYPLDLFLLFSGGLMLDGITDLLGTTTLVDWSAGAWSLPLGVLMLIAEARRWRTWSRDRLMVR
jgi:hypothetical protein